MSEYDEFIASLQVLGESDVRSKLSQGVWASKRKQWVEDWLSQAESSRQEIKDETALSISKEANSIAKSALRVSKFALISAVVAAILGVVATLIAAFITK